MNNTKKEKIKRNKNAKVLKTLKLKSTFKRSIKLF